MHGVFRGGCLLGGDGTYAGEHRAANCAAVVKKKPHYFLYYFFLCGSEWGRGVFIFYILYCLPLFWFDIRVGLILWAPGHGVVESDEGIFYIEEHG